ncbi:MAG: UDP-N-acetylglucosamine--N-acetylmuramyl-(pentapeptide) pyrophosphoryl-undecaprenol N-acetylglucosamine transferase [Candidatus Glassbacteria bacterium]|nr:UDP-N-acetylglucosamine--N-acetylmuramyl-(pentapeptide) pyrophosphoryl-undecaprenol N-acetylglucosamine transferase [Candidatus Glassbacteria bacterium]
MKFVLTGGGTGGHVYPALAIADSLKTRYNDAKFLYIGVRGRAEEKIVPELGYPIRFVASAGVTGGWRGKATAAAKIALGLVQALAILIRFRPDAVIGTGGYASVPAVLAAAVLRRTGLLKTKIFIHEQNYAPGRWNRMISRRADRVWTSFVDSEKFLPGATVEFTGYPVRAEIVPGDKTEARRKLDLPLEARVLIVFGGSQGARSINHALVAALPDLLSDRNLVILHGTGAQKTREYDAPADTARRIAELGLGPDELERYRPFEYFSEIQTCYSAADLCICRGGAGTLNELLTCGMPAIVIPKSSLAGEHQAVNALALAKAGAAEVLFERPVIENGRTRAHVDSGVLAELVTGMLADSARLEKISRAAYEMRVIVDSSVFPRSIASVIDGEGAPVMADTRAQPAWGNLEAVRLASLSPSGVLAHARRTLAGRDSTQLEHHPNISLLRYLADIYLVASRWQVRNIGIKLVGITCYCERRGLLMTLAGDRNPAPLLKRLFCRDYSQVGFIRRNAITVLAGIGVWDAEFEQLLARCLQEDPYYEVRVEAAKAIIRLKQHIKGSNLLTGSLLRNLNHSSLEVVWCCIEALGVTGGADDLSGHAQRFSLHPNWRIRQSLLTATEHLLQRGIITAGDPLIERIEQLIPTCTDFTPSFPLKRSLNRIKQLKQLEGGGKVEP